MKPYWKVTLGYVTFGVLWVFLSDRMIESFAPNAEVLTFLQTIKGWFYVLLSGLLIFFLTKTSFERYREKDREKFLIFRKTLQGVHHILLNYLHQMQLVTMEAERSKDFDREIIVLARSITEEARKQVLRLDQIDELTCDRIESAVRGEPKSDAS